MVIAGFTDIGAAFRVFWSVQVAKVLKLVIGLHVIEDTWALPMSSFKSSMIGALFCDFDFAVDFG